jgi:hypothetical protein
VRVELNELLCGMSASSAGIRSCRRRCSTR